MADLNRKSELTTADLAGRSEEQRTRGAQMREVQDREKPKPVRSDAPEAKYRDNVAPESKSRDNVTQFPGTRVNPAQTASDNAAPTPLFSPSDVQDLRGRWSNVQAGFVDEPRRAVQEADQLVAAVMKRLAEGFADERSNLEKQWDRGDNVSTEDLRLALRRYRSFFDRLLHV